MPNIAALAACPHCGKGVAVLTTASEMWPEHEDEGNAESYAVMCDAHRPNGPGGCGASGGFFPTEAEAIAAWNLRSAGDERSHVICLCPDCVRPAQAPSPSPVPEGQASAGKEGVTHEQIDALDDLVTLVRRLVRALGRAAPDHVLIDSAVDYLRRKGFNSSPFRSASGFDRDFPALAQPAPVQQEAMSDAARDVLAERRRQVEAEGWTPEHDDKHATGEMAEAAACYALHADNGLYIASQRTPPSHWPWDRKWWKPGLPRRMLVKAGALILAEIERRDRAALQPTQGAKGGA